jgi:hypothetical protein
LAALFGSKSFGTEANEEEDEGASPPASGKASPAGVTTKPAELVPMPRAKPQQTSTLQLALADAHAVQPEKSKPAASVENTESKPRTPADIINARGFWGDTFAPPKQATPAQVATIQFTG